MQKYRMMMSDSERDRMLRSGFEPHPSTTAYNLESVDEQQV